MKKLLFHVLFLIIVVGDLVGEFSQNQWIDLTFKPLIMIWIGSYFLYHAKGMDKVVKKLAVLAFLFSWIGDLFMIFMNSGFVFFVMGIVSFLFAQGFYIFLFLHTIELSGKKPFLKKQPYWLIFYLAFGLVFYIVLFNHLESVLRFAVFVYIAAILTMSSMALNRYGNGHPVSFVCVFAGSLLFVASDSMIAINRFLVPIPFEGVFIMATYISAQYLIMRGLLKQYETESVNLQI